MIIGRRDAPGKLLSILGWASAGSSGATTRSHRDIGIQNGSRGTSNYKGMFDQLDVKMDIFDGANKNLWMDGKLGWCYLCQEPIGSGVGHHIGERDHICLQLFLAMYAGFPERRWGSFTLLQRARSSFPALHNHATAFTTSLDHLHSPLDSVRRGELTALLRKLSQKVLKTLQGPTAMSFWYSGERMFKIHLTRLCSQMLPPMSPGVMTQFTHKCWGRTNLERLYDALDIASIVQELGWEPVTYKDDKAYYMRLLFWDLQNSELSEESQMDYVTQLLVEETKRRLCFEMIFLQSMQYMNRVHDLVVDMGFPMYQDLLRLNLI